MKKLLIALLLVGCTEKTAIENNTYPKFTLDQDVQVVAGFYRGKSGKIVNWFPCVDRDSHQETVCYDVKSETDLFKVNQKDLKP